MTYHMKLDIDRRRLLENKEGRTGVYGVREFRLGHIRGPGIMALLLAVAQEKFCPAEGIGLSIVPCSMEALDEGLASGSLAMVRRGPDSDMVASMARGGNIKVVAAVANRPIGDLVVCPQCRSLLELRGKSLAVIHPRLGSTVFLRHLLWQNGLGAKDYTLDTIGETPLRYDALKLGRVTGAMLSPPESWRAKQEGFRVLASLLHSYQAGVTTSFQVNQAFAQPRRSEVVGFLRGLARAHRWVYDPGNKQEVLDGLQAQGCTREEAQRHYSFFIGGKVLSRDCLVDMYAMEQMVDLLTDIGELKRPAPHADYFVDTSYLEEALADLD